MGRRKISDLWLQVLLLGSKCSFKLEKSIVRGNTILNLWIAPILLLHVYLLTLAVDSKPKINNTQLKQTDSFAKSVLPVVYSLNTILLDQKSQFQATCASKLLSTLWFSQSLPLFNSITPKISMCQYMSFLAFSYPNLHWCRN